MQYRAKKAVVKLHYRNIGSVSPFSLEISLAPVECQRRGFIYVDYFNGRANPNS
jgi:hypothetical protein